MLPNLSHKGNNPSEDPGTPGASFEEFLVQRKIVSEDEVERAQRVAGMLTSGKTVASILIELGQLSRADHDRALREFRTHQDLVVILFEDGVINQEQLDSYRGWRKARPEAAERALMVDGGLVSEEQFLRAVSAKHGLSYVDPQVSAPDPALVGQVSLPYLRRNRVVPFRELDGAISVVMHDPLHAAVIQELETIFGKPVKPLCAPEEAILGALRRIENQLDGIEDDDDSTRIHYREIRELDESDDIGAEAIRIVDHLLFRAIKLGASDVHIEPREKDILVRVRVDGVMQTLSQLPAEFALRVAARIKVLAGADLAERRQHQDGRIFVKADGRDVDMRVSIYSSVFGETVVIRLLDRAKGLLPIESLDFEPGILRTVRDALRAPSGLMLITGPTGSGKTTTLYSFIESIREDSVKIITCEDPVEYVLEGTTQCSVDNRAGRGFSTSLRAMMRQDPDVIVVGEIRDRETAELAVEASLTGHKVLSSFHTEDAVSAMIRLLEMGVEPFLVGSTVSAVIAQRLVRRLCSHCSRHGTGSRRDARYLGVSPEELQATNISEAVGCELCDGTGYSGRTAIHEVLVPDDDFRDAVLRRAPSRELRTMAKELPAYLSLHEDGVLRASAGFTTLSEVADQVPRDATARALTDLREIAGRRNH